MEREFWNGRFGHCWLPVAAASVAGLAVEDRVEFADTRGSQRHLTVESTDGGRVLVFRTADRVHRYLHIAFWAEGGVTLAADLMKADEDPRPVAPHLLDRAIAQLPPGVQRIRCRWDAEYSAGDLAKHCINRGVDFAIGVKSNSAVVRASRSARVGGWHPAKDVDQTEVAVIAYLPGTWPTNAGVVSIARWTRIPVELVPTDSRARKLRTIDTTQLALALEGKLDHVYGYSFILTNLDVSTPAKLDSGDQRHRQWPWPGPPAGGPDAP